MKRGVLTLLVAAAPAVDAQTGAVTPRVLDSIAGAGVAQNRALGLVAAVVKGNDTLLFKAYGKANLEWDVAMQTDAIFEIGSVSKQFAAAAILQLLDEGKLSLDDDVMKWMPAGVEAGGVKVTLRQLLNHTSGISAFADSGKFEDNMFGLPRMPRDSAPRMIRLAPLKFPSGKAQAYSNSAFWLLGLVVEKASGMKYEEYLTRKIFEPLGMKRSMYCNSLAYVPRKAQGYGMMGSMIRRAPPVVYEWVFAPGAICSTAGDLVTWLKALHGGKVLSAKSYAEMTTRAKLDDGTELQYGMGIKVGENVRGLKYIGHGGTAPGFRSDATWYPDAQMAVIVLINTSPATIPAGGVGNALATAILPWSSPSFRYYTGDATELVGRYVYALGGNQTAISIEVTKGEQGPLFSVNGSRPERLPWGGALTFYPQETVTLTFRRANGNTGPITELRRDDPGNISILRKQ